MAWPEPGHATVKVLCYALPADVYEQVGLKGFPEHEFEQHWPPLVHDSPDGRQQRLLLQI